MIDFVVEPVRSKLIPGYDSIKNSALESGAIGCCISGSGPSVYALCENEDSANIVIKKMEHTLSKLSTDFHSYVSPINHQGINIIK